MAEAYKQIHKWNTSLDPTPENVQDVYSVTIGPDRAADMAAAVSRAMKDAEAKRRLDDQADAAGGGA